MNATDGTDAADTPSAPASPRRLASAERLKAFTDAVVAIAMTWPFAVTQAHGNLHALSAPREGETLADLARSLHVSLADFEHAAEIARRFGFPLDPQVEKLLARSAR